MKLLLKDLHLFSERFVFSYYYYSFTAKTLAALNVRHVALRNQPMCNSFNYQIMGSLMMTLRTNDPDNDQKVHVLYIK